MTGNTPKKRAKEVKDLLKRVYDDGRGADQCNLVDMLTDLQHFARYYKLDFNGALATASRHEAEEHRDKVIA